MTQVLGMAKAELYGLVMDDEATGRFVQVMDLWKRHPAALREEGDSAMRREQEESQTVSGTVMAHLEAAGTPTGSYSPYHCAWESSVASPDLAAAIWEP